MRVIVIPENRIDFLKQWEHGPYRIEPVSINGDYVVGFGVLENDMYAELHPEMLSYEQKEITLPPEEE